MLSYLKQRQTRIEQQLRVHLPPPPIGPVLPGTVELESAMHYAVLSGGKRLRPLWVYATGEAFGATLPQLDKAACAVEYMHAYSLVHDDLPAMDNDTLRRGQPTCHVRFGEAAALLAGNALQSLAFALLHHAPAQARHCLITACDHAHLLGGQALDLSPLPPCSTDTATTQKHAAHIADIHTRKTGALIHASILLGYFMARKQDTVSPPTILTQYAHHMGLLFQLQDDCFDALNAPTSEASEGMNYVCHFGLDATQQRITALKQAAYQALHACENITTDITPLHIITNWVAQRKI